MPLQSRQLLLLLSIAFNIVSAEVIMNLKNWRRGVAVKAFALQSVDLCLVPLSSPTEDLKQTVLTASCQTLSEKRVVWVKNRQGRLWCSLVSH